MKNKTKQKQKTEAPTTQESPREQTSTRTVLSSYGCEALEASKGLWKWGPAEQPPAVPIADFYLEATPGSAQGLFLVLCSGTTSGGAWQGPYVVLGTESGLAAGKCLTLYCLSNPSCL